MIKPCLVSQNSHANTTDAPHIQARGRNFAKGEPREGVGHDVICQHIAVEEHPQQVVQDSCREPQDRRATTELQDKIEEQVAKEDAAKE